jgi:hypothetical protein
MPVSVEAEQSDAVEAGHGAQAVGAALQQVGDGLAVVELLCHLTDGAGGIAGFDARRRQSLEDDPALMEVQRNVEWLGHAGKEQGEQPRRALRRPHQCQLIAQRVDGGGAEELRQRLTGHPRAAIGEMVADILGDMRDPPILVEHQQEAARLDCGTRAAAVIARPHRCKHSRHWTAARGNPC